MKAIVFDLDGTLCVGGKAMMGALETVTKLEEQGCRVFFLTNNSGKTRQQIVNGLREIGFEATTQNTYCGSWALAAYLAHNQITPVFVIGTNGLMEEITSRRIKMKDDSVVSAVVVGLDHNFTYAKIAKALEAIKGGARLIVANTDPSYPAGDGKILPGCGAMVGAIVGATGHAPDFHVGKPNIYMLESICAEHGLSPLEICVVGDSPESDVRMAVEFGCSNMLFDPEDIFSNFSGRKVRRLQEVIQLLLERRAVKCQLG